MNVEVAIVDDEPRAHKVLQAYLAKMPDIRVVGNFTDALTAYRFFLENKVDIVFLDITMPEVDGFAFLQMLPKPVHVIFTTAHSEFALESYDYDAIDYLKKPIPYERFVKAVTKAINVLESKPADVKIPEHIDLKVDGETRSVPFQTIHYFQSYGNYIKVVTTEKTLLTQMTTHELERSLPTSLFMRIHKSFIVNRSKIAKVDGDEILLEEGARLPIGKTFKKYVSIQFER